MGIITFIKNLFKKQFSFNCTFCDKPDDLIFVRMKEVGADGWEYYRVPFHKSCLHDVLCHPEDYPIEQVEQANEIANRIEKVKKAHKKVIAEAKGHCSKLEEVW